MNFNEMCEIIRKHNQENNIKQQYSDKNALKCRVVISNDTWKRFNMSYSLESRTYEFRSDEKYFLPSMGGNSIFAHSLDGTDDIRLDWYLGDWIIENCYFA